MRPLSRLTRTLAALVALAAVGRAQVAYFYASLDAQQEVPPNFSLATGSACFELDTINLSMTYYLEFSGLSSSQTGAHIHGFAPPGTNAPVLFPLPNGTPITGTIALTASEAQGIIDGQTYVNVHTSQFPNGEIRGQLVQAPPLLRYCFGDGTSGPCPCNNQSTPGSGEGCLNSTGQGGRLVASGFASLHCDSLHLTASGAPGTATAVYIQGTTTSASLPFGDGLRCIGGNLQRLAVATSFGGSSNIPAPGTPSISTLGQLTQTGTYYYQVYYRDPDLTFCPNPPGNSWNITNGYQITWVP